MIKNAIYRAFEKKKKYGWGQWPLFWAIDLHDVIIPGTYTRNNDGKEFFPYAKEALQLISKDPRMSIILWTSSHKQPIDEVIKWLNGYDIHINHINSNPECESNDLCCFDQKFYFDILLDDKAGFDAETEWEGVYSILYIKSLCRKI